jgi:mono/diheme cytochrome c family protein
MMKMKSSALLASAFAIMLAFVFSAAVDGQYAGWTVPPTAKAEKNPLKPSADTVKIGRGIFTAQCQKCHGPQGKGDGPDSSPQAPAADLTDEFRYDLNPEGVVFYKITGGHPPEMPAFKDLLKPDEIWQVVAYVMSLRKPQ